MPRRRSRSRRRTRRKSLLSEAKNTIQTNSAFDRDFSRARAGASYIPKYDEIVADYNELIEMYEAELRARDAELRRNRACCKNYAILVNVLSNVKGRRPRMKRFFNPFTL